MNYILDTNICVQILKEKSFSLLKHTKNRAVSNIYLSTITELELWYGVWNSSKIQENEKILKLFLENFPKLPFTSQAAIICGHLKAHHRKNGKAIGHNDLMIASQALELDAILVTANTKEFKMIKDLRIENWLRNT